MLTAVEVKNAEAKDKPYRLADAGGLALFIAPTGGKSWQLRYRKDGKEQVATLGRFPKMTLAQARAARDAAKQALANPGAAPIVTQTFEEVAREWHRVNTPRWDVDHAKRIIESLEADAFPAFGGEPIDSITPPMVLEMLRKLESRGAHEYVRKLRQRCSAAFVFGIASGVATNDPAAIVKKALAPKAKVVHQPAILDLEGVRAALRAIDEAPARPVSRLAMRLLALTAVRQVELRMATWAEFEALDGPEPLWRVPAAHAKMRREHLVPLSRQAVETIAVLHQVTGAGPLPFPSAHDSHRPMSENALSFMLSRGGFKDKHVPHGWRSSFSTILNERFPADRAVIDLMLAHKPKDAVEAAYNRAPMMRRRRELAQIWADLITEGLLGPETLLDLPKRR